MVHMHILVTNDDGISSPGLAVLAMASALAPPTTSRRQSRHRQSL